MQGPGFVCSITGRCVLNLPQQKDFFCYLSECRHKPFFSFFFKEDQERRYTLYTKDNESVHFESIIKNRTQLPERVGR